MLPSVLSPIAKATTAPPDSITQPRPVSSIAACTSASGIPAREVSLFSCTLWRTRWIAAISAPRACLRRPSFLTMTAADSGVIIWCVSVHVCPDRLAPARDNRRHRDDQTVARPVLLACLDDRTLDCGTCIQGLRLDQQRQTHGALHDIREQGVCRDHENQRNDVNVDIREALRLHRTPALGVLAEAKRRWRGWQRHRRIAVARNRLQHERMELR